jgi:hypothetical protein
VASPYLKSLTSAVIVSVLAGPLLAADGVLLVERTTVNGVVRTTQIQIEKNRMRTELPDGPAGKQAIVFDGLKQVMYIINVDRKTYSEMTSADVDRMGGQMQDAMAMMKSQMASLPPEQRAQMEAMMRGRGLGAPAAPAKTEYKKTGTDKVGKWTCDKYEGFQNGQKTSDLCTVEPSVLGLSGTDFEVTRQLADFVKRLMPQNAGQTFTVGSTAEQGFSGIPVRHVTTTAGRQTAMEITEVSRQSFPDATFTVPSDFQKQDFMGGRGRGRQ